MTLRARLALAAALAAALALAAVTTVGVAVTRQQLRSQADSSLRRQAETIAGTISQQISQGRPRGPRASLADILQVAGGTVAFQVITADGTVAYPSSSILSVDALDIQVATGQHASVTRDRTIGAQHYRQVTVSVSGVGAVQAVRSVDDIDRTVRNLSIGLAVLAVAGIALAAAVGAVVARRALRPVTRLSEAAENVAATQDPGLSVPVEGGAELARLGTSINTMLKALDDAREQQRRLIDDAAHELRTPLTSMRTNVEVLAGGRLTDPDDRSALLSDLTAQLEEFSNLVGDLDQLARGNLSGTTPTAVSFEAVVAAAVRRARRRAGEIAIAVTIDNPGTVVGSAPLLERAVLNVLDNAVKWSPPGGTVRVALQGTELDIVDRGPGVPAEERELVFERFWRSPTARSMPGSGLGLSIVRQVVAAHQGTVSMTSPPGGGTSVHIRLPAGYAWVAPSPPAAGIPSTP